MKRYSAFVAIVGFVLVATACGTDGGALLTSDGAGAQPADENDLPVEADTPTVTSTVTATQSISPERSTPTPTPEIPEGFELVEAPIESLAIITDKYAVGGTTYHGRIVWGLTNSCIESHSRRLIFVSDDVYAIQSLVTKPVGDVACDDSYRADSEQVYIGATNENLVMCEIYHIYAGGIWAEFQASDRNVRCPDPAPTATPFPARVSGGIAADSEILEDALRDLGADVEFVGQVVMNQLFGVWPSELTVNGHTVRIYQLASRELAKEASLTVSSNGYTFTEPESDGIIKSVHREWIDPPHFYLFESSIILYFGSDGEIGELLDSVGTKFAGSLLKKEGSIEWVTVPAVVDKVSIWSIDTDPLEYTVAVFLLVGHCDRKDNIHMQISGNDFRMTATMLVADPPAECIGEPRKPGESFELGSDFENGVEYRVFVNDKLWGSFVGGQVKRQ